MSNCGTHDPLLQQLDRGVPLIIAGSGLNAPTVIERFVKKLVPKAVYRYVLDFWLPVPGVATSRFDKRIITVLTTNPLDLKVCKSCPSKGNTTTHTNVPPLLYPCFAPCHSSPGK